MSRRLIKFMPGVVKTDTAQVAKNYWSDSDRIRFLAQLPQKIGGWAKYVETAFTGVCRGMLSWLDNDGVARLALGTHKKLLVLENDTFNDVTPYEDSGTLTDPFSTTSGSASVTVDDTLHTRAVGDYVNFSGASAVGGITVDGAYTVTTVVNNNQYTITHSSNATSTAGPGGGTVTYGYEIHVGRADAAQGSGYGVGTYGSGTYGTARSTYILLPPRTWSIDRWGEFIVACPRNGKLCVFANDINSRATIITAAPTDNLAMFVTEEKHIVLLGAGGEKMRVDWCDQDDYDTWPPGTDQDTAGTRTLTGGTEIQTGLRTHGGNLILTDASAWFMQFIGGEDVMGFEQVAGSAAGCVSHRAAVDVAGVAYWMGQGDFFYYDGVVRPIPRSDDIAEWVFKNLTDEQKSKCHAVVMQRFNEVWWFYPHGTSEISRYVKFNWKDRCWDVGTLVRTAGTDKDVFSLPLMTSSESYLYEHEGSAVYDDDGSAMNEFITSGPISFPNVEAAAEIFAVFPDFKDQVGSITISLLSKDEAQSSDERTDVFDAITTTTEKADIRAYGKEIRTKISTASTGTHWRLGTLQYDVERGPDR